MREILGLQVAVDGLGPIGVLRFGFQNDSIPPFIYHMTAGRGMSLEDIRIGRERAHVERGSDPDFLTVGPDQADHLREIEHMLNHPRYGVSPAVAVAPNESFMDRMVAASRIVTAEPIIRRPMTATEVQARMSALDPRPMPTLGGQFHVTLGTDGVVEAAGETGDQNDDGFDVSPPEAWTPAIDPERQQVISEGIPPTFPGNLNHFSWIYPEGILAMDGDRRGRIYIGGEVEEGRARLNLQLPNVSFSVRSGLTGDGQDALDAQFRRMRVVVFKHMREWLKAEFERIKVEMPNANYHDLIEDQEDF